MSIHINQVILASYSKWQQLSSQCSLVHPKLSEPTTGSYVCAVCQSSYTNKGNFKQHAEKHFKNGEFAPAAVQNGNNAANPAPPQMLPQLGNFGKSIEGNFFQTYIISCSCTFQTLVAVGAFTNVTSVRARTATLATSSSTC